ncbi:MAG: pilus assembly PilX N-terminal domain-containing protein [Hydrogenophaga sp.]
MNVVTNQRGNTLIVALIMLTLMTLITVASLRLSTTSIQVVGNMQFQEEATAAAHQAIENIITWQYYKDQKFVDNTPAPQNIDINNDGVTDYVVAFERTCLGYQEVDPDTPNLPSQCTDSENLPAAGLCYWGTWDIKATATDARTGASASVHQGVRVMTGLNSFLSLCNS